MKRDSQATMERMIIEWQESGLAIEDFAQKKRITKTKLQYWVRKLHPRGNLNQPLPAFFEITPGLLHNKTDKDGALTPGKLQIELTFPSGLCLKIFG